MAGWILAVVFFAALSAYVFLPGGRLWRQYRREVLDALAEEPAGPLPFFSPEAVESLPTLLRGHLSYCGWLGKPQMSNLCIHFRGARLCAAPGQKPLPVLCQQHSFARGPRRFTYLDTRLFGVPFQRRETCAAGRGCLNVTLAKALPLYRGGGDEPGRALLACLSDAAFLPSLLLLDCIEWTPLDEHRLLGRISREGAGAEGVFIFGELGELLRFESGGQAFETGEHLPTRRVLELGDYRETGGVLFPQSVRVLRRAEEADFVCFSSTGAVPAWNLHLPPQQDPAQGG